MLGGKWTYRSYLNTPALVGSDPKAALADIFGEGVFTLTIDWTILGGTLDMDGLVLDLRGKVELGDGEMPRFEMIGTGRPGTPTDGWEYAYRGASAYRWPSGIDQVPALVGTVLRVKPHDGGKAGVTASFIAVRTADVSSVGAGLTTDPAPEPLARSVSSAIVRLRDQPRQWSSPR